MPHPYLLVYDGDCSLCLAWSRRLVRWAGLTDADRVSHHDLAPGLRARVEAAGLRNELKVVDRADGTITGGFEAIRRFGRGTGLASLVTLSGVPPFRWLFAFAYGVIARNRRVLAPTPGGMVCACDPDPHLGYNLAFVLLATAVAALGWWVFLAVGKSVVAGGGPVAWADAATNVPFLLLPLIIGLVVPTGPRLALTAHEAWICARVVVVFATGSALALVARGAGWGRAVEVAAFAAGVLCGLVVLFVAIRRHAPAMRALIRAFTLPRGGDPP